MSILIKGMDIPKDCSECMNIMLWNVFECNVSDAEEGQRLSSCPLGDVPTPHGRLIDASQFEVFGYDVIEGSFDDGVAFALNRIDDAPTVIEEEE